MQRKILVAGGAGFVGSHLCKALLERGDSVICVDNFHTGSAANIADLHAYPGFESLTHDICYPIYTEIDEIYNLASPASPIHYQNDPIQTTKSNVMGAINLLNLADQTGAKILQASTSEVYGDPLVHPQEESYWGHVNPIGIRACYDEGKRCAETLFFDYYREKKVQIRVARIFNTYGPHMHPHDGRVVSNFIMQALQNQPITIFGNGKQTRSFCYVSDLVTGLLLLMDSEEIGPVNLGNPYEFSMLELAEKILLATKSSSGISFKPLPSDDPKQRQPDITKARKRLGWQPTISLEEGLAKTIEYFKETSLLCSF
ncbi:MAG: UDP-glucuronic acid decarboxylase family protein [Chlamydiales bacterium]